jgi:hypothetical protein
MVITMIDLPYVQVHTNHDLYSSRDIAIAAAKKEFYRVISSSFRYEVENLEESKVESFTRERVAELWEECDTQAKGVDPGGPAIVDVIEFDLLNSEDRKNYKKVIYSLPLNIDSDEEEEE